MNLHKCCDYSSKILHQSWYKEIDPLHTPWPAGRELKPCPQDTQGTKAGVKVQLFKQSKREKKSDKSERSNGRACFVQNWIP